MNKALLEKYFKNSCSDEELVLVLNWLQETGGTPEGKALLHEIWEEMPDNEALVDTNFDQLLNKIHHTINLSTSEERLNIADNNLGKHRRIEAFMRILTRIAAILLIPVLGYGVYSTFLRQASSNNYTQDKMAYYEVTSYQDAITKVTLPDGSFVWLNHNSSLKYPVKFTGKTRIVELKGEGFFEVAHNSQIPFIVEAGDIQVLARGTTFNVSAYSDDDRISTTLINGTVELYRAKSDGEVVPLVIMKPKDLSIFMKAKHDVVTYTIEDDRNYSWKDGTLKFVKEPMSEVIKKLGRWYDADFDVKDSRLNELSYSATFNHETLPEVMKLLSMVSPLRYSISDREKLPNGNFTPRKVNLYYRIK